MQGYALRRSDETACVEDGGEGRGERTDRAGREFISHLLESISRGSFRFFGSFWLRRLFEDSSCPREALGW